ncbi:MAG: hypothetical protein IJA20_02490 [Methanocorpusculum sp.]|nr:hypothetical protein [Methanocorpusculum sp.]
MIPLSLDKSSIKLDSIIYAIVPTGKRNALGRWHNSRNPAELEVLPVRITGIHLQAASTPGDIAALREEWAVEGFEYKKDASPFTLRSFDSLSIQDCFSNIIEANVECVKRINKVTGEKGVVLELCPECQEEVIIYNEGITPCPDCGEPLVPCSICGDCATTLCPYGCRGIGDSERLKPTNPVVPPAIRQQALNHIIEEQEMKRIHDVRLEAIRDFIRFEESSSERFPWSVPAKEMLKDEARLKDVMHRLKWHNTEYESDDLYGLLDKTFGVNPEVKKA